MQKTLCAMFPFNTLAFHNIFLTMYSNAVLECEWNAEQRSLLPLALLNVAKPQLLINLARALHSLLEIVLKSFSRHYSSLRHFYHLHYGVEKWLHLVDAVNVRKHNLLASHFPRAQHLRQSRC